MSTVARRRICFFNTTRFWGGGERWNLVTALKLRDRGHEVSVLAEQGSPLFQRAVDEDLDTTGITITIRSGLNPLKYARIKRYLADRAIDTVVFNGPKDLKAGGLSARSAGVTHRVYQRGLALPVRSHWVNRYLLTNVLTHIVANSEATRRALLSDFDGVRPAPRVEVILLGIDLDGFADRGEARRGRDANTEIVLGTLGRLAAEKDQTALIEVAARLRDRGKSFTLRIGGAGELEQDLRAKAAHLGVEDAVNLVGFVQDVPAFLREIDVFLLSSRWEGFGLALVEAGAAGRPVVAFDTTSTPEVIAQGETGFLVAPGDLDAFTDRVVQLMEDTDLRERMGAAARTRVEERFSVERSIDHFERYVWGQ